MFEYAGLKQTLKTNDIIKFFRSNLTDCPYYAVYISVIFKSKGLQIQLVLAVPTKSLCNVATPW